MKKKKKKNGLFMLIMVERNVLSMLLTFIRIDFSFIKTDNYDRAMSCI